MKQSAISTSITITLLALSFGGGVAHADKMGNFEIQVVNGPTPPGPKQPSNYSFGATQTGSFVKEAGPNATAPEAQSAAGGAPGQAGQPQNFSWGASNPTGQQSATDGQAGGGAPGAQDAGEAGQRPAGTRRGKGIASGKRQHKP